MRLPEDYGFYADRYFLQWLSLWAVMIINSQTLTIHGSCFDKRTGITAS